MNDGFDGLRVMQLMDATRLDDIAKAEYDDIYEWVEENPDYAAQYIAWMRSTLDPDRD